jgi:PAS domain S-box-containing protein
MSVSGRLQQIGRSLCRDNGVHLRHRSLPYALSGFGAGLLLAAAAMTMPTPHFLSALVIFCLLGALVLTLGRFAEGTELRLLNRDTHYRSFFENAIEGIFCSTPDGRYIDVNMALARIYGYPSPAALKLALTDIAAQLYVDSRRRGDFQRLMEAQDKVTDFVSEIRHSDGTTIWISENARAVRDWAGRLVCYEGTVTDVTEKFKAERLMRCALREAEEANRAKSAFLAAMSHELRTPLNAIIGFSEVIKDGLLGAVQPPAYAGYAADIHISGVRLLAIINDVLDVSRLEGGNISLSPEPCTLTVLIDEAVAVAHDLTGDARPVAIDTAMAPPELCVDVNRLRQCLAKLLANAMKFTPDGGTIAVRAALAADGGLRIAVVDTGIGMAPEKVATAIEPFHQLDGSLARRFGGTGLGLSIAKALVELHGGRLEIASAEGEGTTVTITLPASCLTVGDNAAVA